MIYEWKKSLILIRLRLRSRDIRSRLEAPANMSNSQPQVYALVFLYRYLEKDDEKKDDKEQPNHVWFANQVRICQISLPLICD